ncbi:7386_t:CDS:2 [Entrophospora sp. SA101]|nr:7386_t:CDS:2 [Entrophospora sp. SA101]
MSSLRNAVQRRNHKERSQLHSRKRYGLLEKHKDYVLRARDYHSKQERLKKLREKAYFRNPDEFYFKMINSKTKEGVHIQERNNAFSGDMIKLLKSQDLNYVKTQHDLGQKKIEKLKNEIHFIEPNLKREIDDKKLNLLKDQDKQQHIIFVDTKEEERISNLPDRTPSPTAEHLNFKLDEIVTVMKDEIATLGSFGLHHNSKILLIGTKPNANDLAATSSNSSEEHALIQKITQLLHKSKTTLIPQIESFETSSLLVLDGIDFSSNNSSQEFTIARQKRRDAVKFTQQLIDRVDEVKEKLLKANISNSNSGGGGGVLEGAGTGVGIAEDGNVERRNVEGEN